MIEAPGLVKRYGTAAAVNDLSFTIHPGLVTGFPGPNRAGQTTMRLILGPDFPPGGVTLFIAALRYLESWSFGAPLVKTALL